MVGVAIAGMYGERFGDADPTDNPWPTIKGSDFERHWRQFSASRNEAETRAIGKTNAGADS